MGWPWKTQVEPAAVVHQYGPAVYRHLKRIFGPHHDVDDTYQAVFVEILRSLPSFAGKSQLSTWIQRITWNVAYQEMRLRYRDQELLDAQPEQHPDALAGDHADASPEALASRHQARQLLYDALTRLPPKQRMVVVLYDIEGCTLAEISQTLGRPLQTVASQLRTGRAQLGQWMAAQIADKPQERVTPPPVGQRSRS